MIGKCCKVVIENLGRPLEKFHSIFINRASLCRVIKIFASEEEVIRGVRDQRGIDSLRPGNLGDHRAGDKDEECKRAFQDVWSVVRFKAFAK